MKHVIVGVAASLGLALAIGLALGLAYLLFNAPPIFGILMIVVVFGVVAGVLDWYSERPRG